MAESADANVWIGSGTFHNPSEMLVCAGRGSAGGELRRIYFVSGGDSMSGKVTVAWS